MYSCRDSSDKDVFENKTFSTLISKLGQYEEEQVLLLNKESSLLEYQSNLYDFFDLNNGKIHEVKEVLWKKKDENIVVWFYKGDNQKWVSVDYLIWDPKKITW